MTTNETLGRLLYDCFESAFSSLYEHYVPRTFDDTYEKTQSEYDKAAALFADHLGLPEMRKALKNCLDHAQDNDVEPLPPVYREFIEAALKKAEVVDG